MGFIFMEENNKNNKKNNLWWTLGIEVFSKVSTWIVFPVIIALIVGKYLDNRYGTKPLIFLVSTGVAFLVSAFGIFKVAIGYSHKLNKENK
jgi:hypothetical protein